MLELRQCDAQLPVNPLAANVSKGRLCRCLNYVEHPERWFVTAVIRAAEILEGDLPAADRCRFANSIGEQARRLQATSSVC